MSEDEKKRDKLECLLGSLEETLEDLGFSSEFINSTKQYSALRREMTKETDRGVALLATAQLDHQLQRLLERKLVGSKSHFEILFSPHGPLGTFSAKINLSYSLGFLSKMCKGDINIIRKVRNEFAHSNEIIDFENQKIKDMCRNLKLNVYGKNEQPRKVFINVVSGISAHIESSLELFPSFKEREELNLDERKKDFHKIMSYYKSEINKDT